MTAGKLRYNTAIFPDLNLEPKLDQLSPDSLTRVDQVVLATGFFGSLLSIAYAKPATRGQAAVGLALGAAFAYFGTPLAMHFGREWVPASLSPCVAFFLGFFAYRAVPAALALVDRLRELKLPFVG